MLELKVTPTVPEVFAILVAEGRAILRFQQHYVETQAAKATEVEIGGIKVLAVNTTLMASEIGQRLAKDRPFGATFFIRGDGKKVWSLRSRKDSGVNVALIAAQLGGGGHPNAAGFVEG